MISDLGQSRIPKRKDRFKLEYAIFLVVVVIFGLVWLFPEQAGSLPAAWFGVIFALFFGLWILSMLYTFYQWRSWHAAWQQIAEHLGVNFDTHKSKQALIFRWPRISGAYRGRSLDIQRFMRRYGRNVKFYTSIHVGLSGDPGDRLEITPKNWLSGLRKVFESKGSQLQAVQMNDEIFDKRLAVESTSEHFARNVLASSGLRQALLELRSQAPDMKLAVQADALYYHEQSTIRDGEYLAALLGVLHEFADYAERYSIRS